MSHPESVIVSAVATILPGFQISSVYALQCVNCICSSFQFSLLHYIVYLLVLCVCVGGYDAHVPWHMCEGQMTVVGVGSLFLPVGPRTELKLAGLAAVSSTY